MHLPIAPMVLIHDPIQIDCVHDYELNTFCTEHDCLFGRERGAAHPAAAG